MQNVRSLPTTLEVAKHTARVTPFSRGNVLVMIMLGVVMLFGGYFRFVGLNWDDYTHLHPDERFLTGVASAIGGGLNLTEEPAELREQIRQSCMASYPETGGAGGYFDARCSTLNPHNTGNSLYVYGTLPLFIARATGELVVAPLSELWAELQGNPDYTGMVWTQYYGVHLVWRAMSALAEIGVILIVFFMGAKLHDKWIGLLAALLYAGAAFSIQLAHFGTADAIGNFFCALALLFAVCAQREGKLLNYILFGIALGATLASRINLAPMAALIVLAAVIRGLPALHRNVAWGERERLLAQGVAGVVLAGFFTILAFRIFNPYAFNGPDFFGLSLNPRWLEDLAKSREFVTGAIDFPPNYQWASRAQYIYPLKDMILWGMGIVFGIVGWLSFVWSGYRLVRGRAGALLNILPFVWVLGYFGYMGAQWVMVARYFIPLYPALAVLAAWGLFTLVRNANARGSRLPALLARGLLIATAGFTVLWGLMYTNVYRHQLTRVQASYWVWENVPSDFSMVIEGAEAGTPLVQIPLPPCSGSDILIEKATCFDENNPRRSERFVPRGTGTINQIYAPHLADPDDNAQEESLRITIRQEGVDTPLVETTFTSDLPRDNNIMGDAYTIPLPEPFEVEAGSVYFIDFELLEGRIVSGGSIFSWEGAWDDPVPVKVCELPVGIDQIDDPPPGFIPDPLACSGLDPWYGLLNGHEINIVYEDNPEKRQNLIQYLNESDYIAISSNRFYDSQSRNPQRWPMTKVYYEALFDGRLGYDIVAQFDETFELGPIRVSDQHLPTYDSPQWLNEFESDEAFSVYDHPAVFIFQKRADYNPNTVADILYSVPLNRIGEGVLLLGCPLVTTYYCDTTLTNVNPMSTNEVDLAPTQLRFTDEMRAIQSAGGTWSERFNSESPVNTNMVVSVVGWWLTMLLFGFIAFPLMFVAFPRLADRGYAFSKFLGMFLVGWGTWYLASLQIPAWNQVGIGIGMIVLFVLGVALIIRTRAPIALFLRQNWHKLLAIEVLTLLLFLAFLLVRLSNPDLWHPSFGGEKPMDFAYFNGVLRSTIFPPIDPWNAGGYINYYYFGFVIVGTPVLLLQMIPSIAYNLILPTLFATTGIGAFSVAFNAVQAWRERSAARDEDDSKSMNDDPQREKRRKRLIASAWVAGIAAMMMTVFLGNLDTPRTFFSGVARMGGYDQPRGGLDRFLLDEFVEQNQRQPNETELTDLIMRAQSNPIFDRVRYEIGNQADLIASIGRGTGRVLGGERLDIASDRWFWAPSRIYAETAGVEGNAITEMPYFTFIYGDLHAHMISMPIQLFLMAFLLHEVIASGMRERRLRILTLVLGGIAIGMIRATNTWDWITYMIFGVVGLSFVWTLRIRDYKWTILSRRALLDLVIGVGGFLIISFAAVLPYMTWFVTTYSSVQAWDGGKSPIWGYLTIHGLFIFLITSLLVWDTVRWLRAYKVKTLRGTYNALLIGAFLLVGVIAATLALTIRGYSVTIITLPLIVWIAGLFFRTGQTRSMQFMLAAAGLALALTLGVEYIVLEGDIGRQNTVFKFYLQAWLMFSVVSGIALSILLAQSRTWRPSLRAAWTSVLMLLLVVAALFPLMATMGKSVYRLDREQPLTLDGMVYMSRDTAQYFEGNDEVLAANPTLSPFSLNDDYDLIRWMQENIQGSPTIIEGLSESEYKWSARIAINTGLPSVIGWNWHQRQQRTLPNMGRQVEMRVANINAFYQIQDTRTAWDILSFYGAQYIVVGNLERAYYVPAGLRKLDELVEMGLLEIAYERDGTLLYHVVEGAMYPRNTEQALDNRLDGQG